MTYPELRVSKVTKNKLANNYYKQDYRNLDSKQKKEVDRSYNTIQHSNKVAKKYNSLIRKEKALGVTF